MTKLNTIPFADLQRGDRVFHQTVNRSGTIHMVPKDGEVLQIRWDRAPDVAYDEPNLDGIVYQGRWKQYCVVSKVAFALMNGNRGKLIAQAGHAFQFAGWDAHDRYPEHLRHYRQSMSAAKVTLGSGAKESVEDLLAAEDSAALEALYNAYKGVCGVTFVKDEGRTVFKVPTVTVVGVGPLRTDRYGDMRGSDLTGLRPLI